MPEKLYTIPVKEAYSHDCECPLCNMYNAIEKSVIEFVMGPSYMEDDIRAATDKTGFCKEHARQLMACENRLGMALILSTHLKKTNSDIAKLSAADKPSTLFHKKDFSSLLNYIDNLDNSCYVCDRVDAVFDRYIATIYHLWKTDKEFKKTYETSKGFCTKHYAELIRGASKHFNSKQLDEFTDVTNKLYYENMERIREDINWFINKFDYMYRNEPWKNSKDALPRTLTKVNGIMDE
ncbi:MAG: DUF6062 family protein [Eubacterium sp.]